MTGPKLNEGVLLVAPDQPTTKATARYLRGSATKARVVLDLIRGLDVRRADEVLQFTTRDAAKDVRKVLASAVANAVHNDEQDADELFVLAAFADEGPTLRRFRPRARGRATRIRKRTCHITVIVARLSERRLEVLQNRQQGATPAGRRRAGTTAQSRRDRVERSRTRAQGLRAGATDTPAADVDAVDVTEETAADEQGFAEFANETEVPTASDTDAGIAEGSASGEAESSERDHPTGSVLAPEDGSVPVGFEIKGNADSMKYHVPDGRYYDATIAEVFFDTVEHAEAAGYEAPAADEAAVEELQEEQAAAEEAAVADMADVQAFADTDAPEAESETAEAELPEGAVAAPEDGSTPAGYEIKGNASSKKYHVPGGRYYDVTIAEVFFDTAEHAEAAGYEAPAADVTDGDM
ncbi:MAG: 50S ribosomal protein L22 [Acidimicrobiia bacterium]|nr:50S ribosomal protein L22 [Acidimicrobiia bacterium]